MQAALGSRQPARAAQRVGKDSAISSSAFPPTPIGCRWAEVLALATAGVKLHLMRRSTVPPPIMHPRGLSPTRRISRARAT